MPLQALELPAAADFHVHLRDGAMAAAVVPTVRRGGVNTVYVMPNLVPPVATVEAALAYRARLRALDPAVDYRMTLFLCPEVTPAVVRAAAAAGIAGVKSYPAGVTTNSDGGVVSYERYYDVFEAMEECGLVLNLHGECPADERGGDVTILNAEARFLPTLKTLHERFPRLRIVLEHCTTADAVEAVRACGDTVVGTITSHHLFLTIDDAASDVLPADRLALLRAVVASKGKFFLGTDSAPHDVAAKKGGRGKTAAGVFTQPYALALVMTALEEAVARGDVREDDATPEALEGFFGAYGRKFYGIADESGERIRLSPEPTVIADTIQGDGVEVVPFRLGGRTWTVEWI